MNYEVHIVRAAERDLDRLPASTQTRIQRRILALEEDPRPKGVQKPSGREEYRLRTGDYRVLYTIDDRRRTVTIVAIGHRREVYG